MLERIFVCVRSVDVSHRKVDKITGVCECVCTYSAESAGRMDIGERWEL